MSNLFTFDEIGITYTSKGLGSRIVSSRQVYELLLPNWLDIYYVESFQLLMLNRGNRLSERLEDCERVARLKL